MRKEELEKQLECSDNLLIKQSVEINNLREKITDLMDRVEELTKTKADLLGDVVQYRTATFRLHESNAALLTLINKHQI